MNLKELVVDQKTVWVEFDDIIPGFEVELHYIPRTEMTALVKDCQKTKMNRSTKAIETTLDDDKFINRLVGKAISNWKGLTTQNIKELLPNIRSEGPEEEVNFSQENAVFLVKESGRFDEWLNEKLSDISSFR
jgi:hypothetical protein